MNLIKLFMNGNFFLLTLLNVSSFTSNSYFVSINFVRIIRNCRVVTTSYKVSMFTIHKQWEMTSVLLHKATHFKLTMSSSFQSLSTLF